MRRILTLSLATFCLGCFPAITQAQTVYAPNAMPLPTGVPVSTTSFHTCIKDWERDQYQRHIESTRINLRGAGCNKGVVAPKRAVVAWKKGIGGPNKSCEFTRKDAFSAGYLDIFQQDIVDLTNTETQGTNAFCAANMLYYWASHNAMFDALPGDNQQRNLTASQMSRAWALSGVATAYFNGPRTQDEAKRQIVDYETGRTKHDVILDWMKSLSNKIGSEVDTDTAHIADGEDDFSVTNRHFWRGYAILPVGIMRNDKNIMRRSLTVFMSGINEIQGEGEDASGFMQEELVRQNKSLFYHGYALQPLLGMALLSKAVNCDFGDTTWRRSKLTYLLRKTAQGHYDPQVFVDAVNTRTNYRITSVSGSSIGKDMLYWGNEVDPYIFNNTKSYLLKKNLTYPSLTPLGIGMGHIRLGGSYRITAERVKALRLTAGECPI